LFVYPVSLPRNRLADCVKGSNLLAMPIQYGLPRKLWDDVVQSLPHVISMEAVLAVKRQSIITEYKRHGNPALLFNRRKSELISQYGNISMRNGDYLSAVSEWLTLQSYNLCSSGIFGEKCVPTATCLNQLIVILFYIM
jgi:hypothetical protein